MADFFNSKYGIYFITFILFAFVGYILRFLFGPKGVFRDKNLTYDSEKTEKKDNE